MKMAGKGLQLPPPQLAAKGRHHAREGRGAGADLLHEPPWYMVLVRHLSYVCLQEISTLVHIYHICHIKSPCDDF